jgi:exodeoxyribonuclease III
LRFATWNVNSLKARLPRVEEWLGYAQPDVLCMQETKLSDDTFPQLTFSALGWDAVHHGPGQWNGVATLSKVGIDDVSSGFGEGVLDPYEGDARLLATTCGGIRFVNVYVPNGREVGSDFYDRKLEWLSCLYDWVTSCLEPTDPVVMLGDFNVAPEDRDVWLPSAFKNSTHVTPPEREAVARLRDWGLVDAFRAIYGDQTGLFTYWDYRRGDFHQHKGMRIDLVLVTKPVAERLRWALVDRNARKGKLPSDHAPLVFDLDD